MILLNKKSIRKVCQHTLFWIASIGVFAFIFRLSETVNRLDVMYSLLFHLTMLLAVYINFWSLKRWFTQARYFIYAIFTAIIVGVTVALNQYTFDVLVDIILPDYYFVSQFNHLEIAIIILGFLTITATIKLSKSWFALQALHQQTLEREKEKIDSELQSLRAQINPHFLFNSLNVLYSLILKNDPATPDVLLQLSDILRYVIYDSTQDKVPIRSEVLLLEQYIHLQSYRIEEEAIINFRSDIIRDVAVAPLLFLTLLENSFKHGIKNDIDQVFIDINIRSDEKAILFEIENNKPHSQEQFDQHKGVGLRNIKKRLALQYPNKHHLTIVENDKTFKVSLKIEHEN